MCCFNNFCFFEAGDYNDVSLLGHGHPTAKQASFSPESRAARDLC